MVEQVEACAAGVVLAIGVVSLLLWRRCSGCGSTPEPIVVASEPIAASVSERSNGPAATVEERMARVSQDLAKLMTQSSAPDPVKDFKEDQLLFQEIWTVVEASSPSCSEASPSPQRFSQSASLSPQRQLRRRTSRVESPPAPTARASPLPEPLVHSPVAAKSPSITRTSRADSPAPRAAAPAAPLPGPIAIEADSSSDESFPEEVNELNLPPQELALVALINFATLDELKELKGIGAKSAVSIMSYRSKGGAPFACLDDLTKAGLAKTVKGRLLKANT